MMLTDSVELLRLETNGSLTSRGNTPAQVTYAASGEFTREDKTINGNGDVVGTTTRTGYVQEIRVVVGDVEFDAVTDRIRWNGNLYKTVGQHMLRRRNGRTHHKTIPVEVVT